MYSQLNLPILDGRVLDEQEVDNTVPSPTLVVEKKPQIKTTVKENEKVSTALKEIDRWIEDKSYKLNIGQTTNNVRALNDARKNINTYLFAVIDWASEGVPLDAVVRVRDTSNKFLVAFERQTMKSDAVVTLPASIESRKIIEAFIRWNEVGNKSWNFEGSTDYLFRVQMWTESIKPKIVQSILRFENTEVDYFTYAAASEYYRLIFNGQCKKMQSPQNFSVEMLLQKKEVDNGANGHTKNWNDLLKKMNGPDGDDIRNCMLQYYNLPQGTAVTSTNYEYDYVAFNKAVRKVINTGLVFTDNDLQLEDPVRKRRLVSEHLKFILDRIDTVVEEEKKSLEATVSQMSGLIELDEIDSEEDIKDIIAEIKRFYTQAQKSHISVATHYNVPLINSCNKNVSSILSALRTYRQICETSNTQKLLLKFSRDPVQGMREFVSLVERAGKDVDTANQELDGRMSDSIPAGEGNDDNHYLTEVQSIQICKKLIAEMKNNVN